MSSFFSPLACLVVFVPTIRLRMCLYSCFALGSAMESCLSSLPSFYSDFDLRAKQLTHKLLSKGYNSNGRRKFCCRDDEYII